MRDILIAGIILSTIPFILRRPYIGVLVFTWLGLMNPHRAAWGFAYDMPFSAIIAVVTFVALIGNRELKRLPFQYFIVFIWLAWIVWMNLTTLFALEPDTAYPEWERAVKIQAMSMVAIMLLQSKEKIIFFIWTLVVSVGFYGVKGGIFTVLTAGNHMVFGPVDTFFTGNNGLAIALLMVIPLMWFLQTQVKSKLVRILLIGSIFFCIFSVVASYSRGAFLALSAVLFYFFLKSRRKALIAPLVIIFAALMLSFMPAKYTERIETIETYAEDRSVLGRFNAWYFAVNVAKDNPVTGGGFGVFVPQQFYKYAPEPENYHDAHSIYFESLGEHGFTGLALFLALGLTGLRLNSSIVKRCKGHEELIWASRLAEMLYVGLIGYAVGGLFLGLAYFDLYYHLLALSVLVRIEVDRHLNKKSESKEIESREARLT